MHVVEPIQRVARNHTLCSIVVTEINHHVVITLGCRLFQHLDDALERRVSIRASRPTRNSRRVHSHHRESLAVDAVRVHQPEPGHEVLLQSRHLFIRHDALWASRSVIIRQLCQHDGALRNGSSVNIVRRSNRFRRHRHRGGFHRRIGHDNCLFRHVHHRRGGFRHGIRTTRSAAFVVCRFGRVRRLRILNRRLRRLRRSDGGVIATRRYRFHRRSQRIRILGASFRRLFRRYRRHHCISDYY